MQSLLRARDLEEGYWVTSDFQSSGRGQRAKKWIGEPGLNFYGSLLLRPSFLLAEQQFRLNIAVSLAIQRAIQEFIPGTAVIKWPNDILSESKKLSGVLIENSIAGVSIETSIVGIGVNINQSKFPGETMSSLLLERGQHVPIAVFFDKLRHAIAHFYGKLKEGEDLKSFYIDQMYGYRKQVRILEEDEVVSGNIKTLDDNGCIHFLCDNGELKRFCSGQISFVL